MLIHCFSPELNGYRCLSELTVGILGIGQIGMSSAKLLRGFIFLKQPLGRNIKLDVYLQVWAAKF